MATPRIIIFESLTSQTGRAASEEFPGAEFEGVPTFDEMADALSKEIVLGVLPTWNSHQGEIVSAKVLELLFEGRARLHRFWPKTIVFECITKSPDKEVRRVVSVGVARTQCSRFLDSLGAEFVPVRSTNEAYTQFRNQPSLDAALCTPGQNEHFYPTLLANASNPVNFTTFGLLGCCRSKEWGGQEWAVLKQAVTPRLAMYFGIEMPILTVSSSEDQQALLNDLTRDAEIIDQIPKVLFVARRKPDTCGLLVETRKPVVPSEIITDDGYSSEIAVKPDIGATNRPYAERAYEFIRSKFPAMLEADFVRHRGTETCFFACPPLGVLTHGFEEKVVEPVVKKLISKYFELYVNGVACTDPQREFFERHKSAFFDKGADFLTFQDVGI